MFLQTEKKAEVESLLEFWMQNLTIYKLDNKIIIIINVQLSLKCEYVFNKMKNNIFYIHNKVLINEHYFYTISTFKKYMHHNF